MTNKNTDQVITKKLFDTDVDVSVYDKLHSDAANDRQINAKFLKFTWIDISNKNIEDDDLQNLGIREAQNDRLDDIQNLKISLSRGWDTSFFPPCYGTDNRFRDGRGRVISAIEKDQKWMIVALYAYDDDEKPVTNYLANGLRANDSHSPAGLSCMKDYEDAGVALILNGELDNTRDKIDDFLYRICRIERRFPGNIGGHITKIRENIYRRAKEGLNGATIRRKDENEWKEWIDKSFSKNPLYWNQNYGISDISEKAFHKTGRGAAERILTRHILPNAAMGKITNIILYAGSSTREDMIKEHIAFEKTLQELYSWTYKWINNEIRGIELKNDVNSPMWNICGVIPQFLNDDLHESYYKKGYLVPMSQIRNLNPLFNVLNFAA